jgi:hypothetical protein
MTHTSEAGRRCHVCQKPALGRYGAYAYCEGHRPSIGRCVTLGDVLDARTSMLSGYTLKQTASDLGLMASDLDVELWRWMGRDIPAAPKRYAPDFEGAA